MAAVTKVGTPSLASPEPPPCLKISELYAGEDLGACDSCYIKAADNKVYKATGAAANEAAVHAGFTMRAVKNGQPVTLWHSVMMGYVNTNNPGIPLFLSGTVAGGLDTAASTGGTTAIARVVDGNRIYALPLK